MKIATFLVLLSSPLTFASDGACHSLTRPNIGDLTREWSQWTDCSLGVEESLRQRKGFAKPESPILKSSWVVQTETRPCCNKNDLSKILTVGGHPDREAASAASEVIHVTKSGAHKKICVNLPPFPVRHGGAGALLYDKYPFVCGGSGEKERNACYIFTTKTQWTRAATLLAGRNHPAAIAVDSKTLFVVGGHTGGAYTQTTEFVSLKGSRPGPPMPEAHYAGCFVKFNETSAIAMGGYTGQTFKLSMYIYHIPGNSWGRGPNINVGRYTQACGAFQDSSNANLKYVVMAGGYDSTTYISSTEIWVVGSPKWTWGPELPSKNFGGSSMVQEQDGKSVLLIGGYGINAEIKLGSVYRLKCFNGNCGWNKLGVELGVPRGWHTSILIPNSLVECVDDSEERKQS